MSSVATTGTHDTETLAEWWETAHPTTSAGHSVRVPALSEAGLRGRRAILGPALRDALIAALFGAGVGDSACCLFRIFSGGAYRINTPAVVNDCQLDVAAAVAGFLLGSAAPHPQAQERAGSLPAAPPLAERHGRMLRCPPHADAGSHCGRPRAARRPCPRDRPLALQPGDRHARSGWRRRSSSTSIRSRTCRRLRRPEEVRLVRGRLAPRRAGAPLGAEGFADKPSTSSRPAARPASRRAASSSTTSASTTRCSATRCRKVLPKGSQLADARPVRPAAAAAGGRAPGQHRGGICFCVDLDPRWVVKLIKKGWMEHLEAYKDHCIDQAMTILSAGHDIKCMFTTPKLLEALALRLEAKGTSDRARPASPASSAAAPS